MEKLKNINYFSVDMVDLREVAGNGSRVIDADDLSVVFNGKPSVSPFLREGEIYQLPEPRLLLVISGEADVHLNLEQYHFNRGAVVLTSPDTILEVERCSDDLMVSGLAVKESLDVDEITVAFASARDFEQLEHMLYIIGDIADRDASRRDTLRHLVLAMISSVKHIKQATENTSFTTLPTRGQQQFQRFKALVNKYCEKERNIPFYAQQLQVTPHHLSAVISRASGHSVMYWINRAVALRAKVLLRTTDLMTYEIAERLNFSNPPTFNNFFKRETGMTPKMYRELPLDEK